jgi:hypothetical protein
MAQGLEPDADHLLGALAHLPEPLEQVLVRGQPLRQLRQLRDRDTEVAHALEVQVGMQHREHEPKVGGDRSLPGEQLLDAGLDRDVDLVDLVVEGDHLVRELGVLRGDGLDGGAQRAEHELALGLQRGLEVCELLLEGQAHDHLYPNLPVT